MWFLGVLMMSQIVIKMKQSVTKLIPVIGCTADGIRSKTIEIEILKSTF